MLLDSQSTVSVFKNSNFLTNVRRSNSQLNVHTNDGTQISNVIDYSFVSTVANNKAQFPRREIEGADKARALYRKIGRPSQHQFEQILAKNLIRNCPVTVDDAKRALLIYGPNVAALYGKQTKATPNMSLLSTRYKSQVLSCSTTVM